MRHTFAIWNLVIGVHPERLVALMGHGSKQMVYEVYGRYMEGVERDADAIREYFGLKNKGLDSGDSWRDSSRNRGHPMDLSPEDQGGFSGAGNGIRTRDFDLGKVALYH